MANEWNPENIFELLSDDRARSILLATYEQQRSVQDLAQICEGSLSSLYRRVNVMVDYNLLHEQRIVDPDGHHYNVYETQFRDIRIIPRSQEDLIIRIQYNKKSDVEIRETWDSLSDG